MTEEYGRLLDTDIALLEAVRQAFMRDGTPLPDWREGAPEIQTFRDRVRRVLLPLVRPDELEAATRRVADALSGVGLLQPFLREQDVEEVYVRGGEVAVERDGRLERLGEMAPASYWEKLIYRVAEQSGQAVTPRHPAVLVDLPGGERFTGMLPPLMDAPAINIRVFGKTAHTRLRALGAFDKYESGVRGGLDDIRDTALRERVAALPAGPERFLAWLMASQAGNILIAGEFSSGKTTMLNYLSGYIPAAAPVAVLETFRELQLAPHLFTMRAVAPSELLPGEEPRATMEWVLNVVYTRANPAAIILGEIVSRGEAMQFLKAANLGRRAYATIHGGTVAAALGRLEQLALAAQPDMGLGAVRSLVAGGLDVVLYMGRTPQKGKIRRFAAEIVRIAGLNPDGRYRLERLYSGWLSAPSDPLTEAWEALR